jgi:isopentenyl phosphate kinase
MSPEELSEILERVLGLTNQMLEFAREENWLELAKLEAKRQNQLMSSFENAGADVSGSLAPKIQQILEIDHEMQSLVIKARNEIRDELIRLNKEKDAAKAYAAE